MHGNPKKLNREQTVFMLMQLLNAHLERDKKKNNSPCKRKNFKEKTLPLSKTRCTVHFLLCDASQQNV